jgi:RES domain-containing protein
MKLYRLARERGSLRADDLSGESAALAGGRWSPRGQRAVYACFHASTAVLELLVHSGGMLPASGLYLVTLEVTDRCIDDAYRPEPPSGWGEPGRDPRLAVETGRKWLEAGEQLAMWVPSLACPLESTVLLNPLHEDMGAVKVLDKERFLLDHRTFSGLV